MRIWTILGDGELFEGSNWEALAIAAKYNLTNMIAILDLNKMGQSDWTSHSDTTHWNEDVYKQKAEAFGWHAIVVDGHNVDELTKA